MFAKIFVKEWRENILVFSIAVLMMLALTVLNFSSREEMTLLFSGMFLLVFLPFAALLVGSSGFYSEHKDKAWIYLLSRPIRKELIWIFKYVSQLSVLLAIFLIFFAAKRFLPGLDRILEDINFPAYDFGLVSFSLYVVIPLVAFTVSFSLSLLSEKPFITFFATVILGTALMFVFQQYVEFLWWTFFHVDNLNFFWLFIGASFIAASILTFLKSDFSQPREKIFIFSRYLILFLILSFLAGTVVFTEGRIFSAGKSFDPYLAQKMEEDVYFPTYGRGILKYDGQKDEVEKLSHTSSFMLFNLDFSLRGAKIAFLKEAKGKRDWHRDLWIMNEDGSGERVLVESHREDSPFHRLYIQSLILSSSAEKVAFITAESSPRAAERVPILWWMNADGTDLKSQTLADLSKSTCRLLAWPPSEDYLILLAERKLPPQQSEKKIIRVRLGDGSSQVLAENVTTEYQIKVSPGHDFLAFTSFDPGTKKKTLSVLDLKTLDEMRVAEAEPLKLGMGKWSQDGSKIAYLLNGELCVYAVNNKKSWSIAKGSPEQEFGMAFDWISKGSRLVLVYPLNGGYCLKITAEESSEEKVIRIPHRIERPILIWGLEDRVLLKGAKGGPLWRVDPKTEEWKKVY